MAKLLYSLFIIVGAGLLFYTNWGSEEDKIYITVFAFVLLMFGLYKSTRYWVKDNPKNTQKDPFVFMEKDDEEKSGADN
ncbi:hypothetical protein [Ascidiimonas aurantiaca]|uniref:hypothetical protein n=1 Tax=Ascidiimonas aurantiaca TaxID=1685432 RepID=UPI0030EB5D79